MSRVPTSRSTANETNRSPGHDQKPELPAIRRAAVRHRYGGTEVIEIEALDMPTVGPDTILIEVEAASVNPLDWHMMTGTPWPVRMGAGFRRPKHPPLGVDVAGTVVAVGSNVSAVTIGDEVVGAADSSFATHASVKSTSVVRKAAGVSMEESAGMVVAAITALQGLRDKANLQPGQRVLINGASGGVGSAAVQLAKHLGAEVTAVCSTRNVDLVRSLGADHVIDYTSTDFTETDERYDVLFDNQGNRPLRACRRLLTDQGVYLMIGGPKSNPVLGPIARMIRTFAYFAIGGKRGTAFIAQIESDDLTYLVELMEAGHLRTEIDTVYPLDEVAAAIAKLGDGHVRGKLIIKP